MFTACDTAWERAEAVVASGQEGLIAEMVGHGVTLPGECRLTGHQVDHAIIRALYVCVGGKIEVELYHPSVDAPSVTRTEQFAIVLRRGSPPPAFVDALAARIRSREAAFRWEWIAGRSAVETVLLVAAFILPAAAAVAEWARLAGVLHRWRRERTTADKRRVIVSTLVTTIRIAGLVAVLLIAHRSTAALAAHPEFGAATFCGVVWVVAFLWLVVSGFFGYGTARRSDLIGLVPFLVALIVREMFTLHSVQEIEIQFAQGPVGRHSVVYPLLQMFFAPLVGDPQWFTMEMNALLGSLACLSMYLFVRQRLQSRAAGFLCAFFLATHPLVARFSPTDGPYALLLAAWFSGLALLSAPALEARGVLGGIVLLGIAATLRIEGVVVLVASLLMLDLQALADGLRSDRVTAVFALLAAATLGAVQMYFVLPFNLGNSPAMPTLSAMLWPLAYSGSVCTVLVVLGALSGIVTRRWLGLFACIAMLLVTAPVAYSTYAVALHRLVPAFALQAMVAGIGAYSLTAWIPAGRSWTWCAAVPGVLAACSLLIERRSDLTQPYVFTEEYALVRRHLAPRGVPVPDCTLMTLNAVAGGDADLHDFNQVLPGTRVLDCSSTDCVVELSTPGCFYYIRSAACYFHPDGVPAACANAATVDAGDPFGCLGESSASFERSVELEPVEVLMIDLHATFAEFSPNYPPRAQIGLFRVHPKGAGSPEARVPAAPKLEESRIERRTDR